MYIYVKIWLSSLIFWEFLNIFMLSFLSHLCSIGLSRYCFSLPICANMPAKKQNKKINWVPSTYQALCQITLTYQAQARFCAPLIFIFSITVYHTSFSVPALIYLQLLRYAILFHPLMLSHIVFPLSSFVDLVKSYLIIKTQFQYTLFRKSSLKTTG